MYHLDFWAAVVGVGVGVVRAEVEGDWEAEGRSRGKWLRDRRLKCMYVKKAKSERIEGLNKARKRRTERERERDRQGLQDRAAKAGQLYLLMRMTMVVMMAAKKTNPPKTPSAIMPPAKKESGSMKAEVKVSSLILTEIELRLSRLSGSVIVLDRARHVGTLTGVGLDVGRVGDLVVHRGQRGASREAVVSGTERFPGKV